MENPFTSSKLMDRFFRRVDGVVWDLMTGRVGVNTSDGIVTCEGSGDDWQITQNVFDNFGVPIPAFAQNTPAAAVNVGDLIYGDNKARGWVVAKTEKTFTLLTPSGTRSSWQPPKVAILGMDGGVMVLRSLINMLPGGAGGLGQMQSMLMPMLMMGGENLDLGSIMPMMMMSQMNQPATVDPANPAATLVAQNQMGNMMQMMLMMQLLGKGGGGGTSGSGGNRPGSSFFDLKR